MVTSPTMRRKELGLRLRGYREAAGKRIEQVAEHLERSTATISRVETGRQPVRVMDVERMLAFYGVHGPEIDEVLHLTRTAKDRGWWEDYNDVLGTGPSYVGLEAAARSVRVFDPFTVPQLLQTADYARAICTARRMAISPHAVERLVETRLRRQRRFKELPVLSFWAVIDESVLHRTVGGREVQRAQLARLAELAAYPQVTLQVLPAGIGAHPGLVGGFTVLDFDGGPKQSIYLENLTGHQLLEKPVEAEEYVWVFDQLRARALGPEESVDKIQTAVNG
ncbi:XRE family transcriptional regulator [Pseudonocardiaceae bacterium YIM PH 21723]|nr:XRE family transcriptional regulator [Pseudonocardiaceae bacterium YIM PH 21723]